jgi:hypothetical protein
MALLDDVKKSLRISAAVFDGEVTDLISAAKLDLEIAGIVNLDETNPLIKRAIMLYCKTNFGLSNPDMEKYQAAYDMLKNHLAISSDFNSEVV